MANTRGDHFTVTMTGSPIRLTENVVGRTWPLRVIAFSADPANVAVVYGGMKAALTSADYGFRIPAPVAAEPVAPFVLGEFRDGTMEAENFWLFGQAGDKVHVMILGATP